MKLLTELKVKPNYKENDIYDAVKKQYHIFRDEIIFLEIVKESIDSRKKPNIVIKLNVAVEVKNTAKNKVKNLTEIQVNHNGVEENRINFQAKRPIVVGFGPAGMFAGLALAKAGLRPIILEQGKCVQERQKDVDEFWKNRKLNKYSNIQFGEGGAGTFSDGKLASNVNNEYTKTCINEFILCGAPKDIFYSYTPHIGSDELKKVVTNLRKKIEELGGEILFNTKFVSFEEENGEITKVFAENTQTKEKQEFVTDSLILAVGHSAVEVYELLKEKRVSLKQKPFAMGVRIEGLQSDINIAQYGDYNGELPPANYKLTEHLPSGRSVFTFCMCPGGYVVASSSEEGTVVTNGMSYHGRNGTNANSALLVNVVPEDYGSDDPLAGVWFQRKYEKLAYEIGGKNYNAPAEKVVDFLTRKTENFDKNFDKVVSTYLPAITVCDISKCLPKFVTESLREALPKLGKKLSKFDHEDNLLVAVESRSSAPVQIVRDENLMANVKGIFPAGEGAGYAGGITSSSADGIKIAEKVIEYLKTKSN